MTFLDPGTYLNGSGLLRSSFSMSQMSRNTPNPSPQPRKLIFQKNIKQFHNFPVLLKSTIFPSILPQAFFSPQKMRPEICWTCTNPKKSFCFWYVLVIVCNIFGHCQLINSSFRTAGTVILKQLQLRSDFLRKIY